MFGITFCNEKTWGKCLLEDGEILASSPKYMRHKKRHDHNIEFTVPYSYWKATGQKYEE